MTWHNVTCAMATYAVQPCAMADYDCDGEPTVTLTRVMIMTTCTQTIVEFRYKYVAGSRPSECEYLDDRYPVTAIPHSIAARKMSTIFKPLGLYIRTFFTKHRTEPNYGYVY